MAVVVEKARQAWHGHARPFPSTRVFPKPVKPVQPGQAVLQFREQRL